MFSFALGDAAETMAGKERAVAEAARINPRRERRILIGKLEFDHA